MIHNFVIPGIDTVCRCESSAVSPTCGGRDERDGLVFSCRVRGWRVVEVRVDADGRSDGQRMNHCLVRMGEGRITSTRILGGRWMRSG